MKHFLHTEPPYTKYRTVRRKTPRLKVKVWSIDLTYVDNLAHYNKNIKYHMDIVDCMSHYLRAKPLKSKYDTSTAEAFKQMLKPKLPKKLWIDKGTEFKESFENVCEAKGIEIYTTESLKKSAFAERNIRSLRGLNNKYLEDK